MSTVCEKDKCCGCNACVNICPKKAITLVDNIKSLNAIIDENLCVNCNMCKKVCQVINLDTNLIEFNSVEKCYEGVTKNDDINIKSSSGGFATTLGYEFAKNGGYVVGIKSDEESFYFDITNNQEEVKLFAGSKYVKVLTGNIYKQVKKKLNSNEKVLFFGVPCQVAGLIMFLQKDYDNLYTVDLICHGSPSEKVLLKYLNERGLKNTQNLMFRKKHYMHLCKLEKCKALSTFSDAYIAGFKNGLFFTDNCYSCKYAQNNRVSDITIGDSWGSSIEEKNGLKNLSLVLINTEKGMELKELVKDKFDFYEREFEDAVAYNDQLNKPTSKQKYTDYYFEHFDDMSTYKIVKKAYPKTILKQRIKYFLVKMHLK